MFRSLNLAGQAQANRDLARRARRLADTVAAPADRSRLRRHAEELEAQADRLEHEATEARFTIIAPTPANDAAD